MDDAKHAVKRAKEYYKFQPHQLAAQAILADISDRGGVKHAFAGVDESVMNDILKTWSAIIEECWGENAPTGGRR